MRIVFMGTPDFAIPSLKILLDNAYPVVAAVTVPDKPQGRGLEPLPSPVKRFAQKHALPLLQPEKLSAEEFALQLKTLQPDLFVVVAFRILPKSIYSIARLGTFNLHASLLPKYRGAAPIQWAIINGEKETGVTTFFLEEKVDTGNILLQARLPIGPDETFGELHGRLAEIGGEIVLHTVRLIEMKKATPRMQVGQPSPAPKILREQCRIDWLQSAEKIHNLVRGMSPSPCTFTQHNGKTIKIFRTRIAENHSTMTAGSILEANSKLIVAADQGSLEILELQLEGKRRMKTNEFLRGYQMKVGEKFSQEL